MTPPGERFVPTWTTEGISEIRDVLTAGLELLRGEIAPASNRATAGEA
jgi:hypothetical protein